jgi:hypothetical protein
MIMDPGQPWVRNVRCLVIGKITKAKMTGVVWLER